MTEQEVDTVLRNCITGKRLDEFEKIGFGRGTITGFQPKTGMLTQLTVSNTKGSLEDLVTGKVIAEKSYKFETNDPIVAEAYNKFIAEQLLGRQ